MTSDKIIRGRLRTKQVWVGAVEDPPVTRTAMFGEVPDHRVRNLLSLTISGDPWNALHIIFEKLEEDGTTYTLVFGAVPIAQNAIVPLPQANDAGLQKTLKRFEGGTRLFGSVDGNSLSVTERYWDQGLY